MQNSKQVFEAYNQALQYGPQSTPSQRSENPHFVADKASVWLDVAIAVAVGLMLAIGALSYFDVLVK